MTETRLPVEAYTSQEWFEREQQEIFRNSWQFAGLVEDITDVGDYITVQCGYQNIVIIKAEDQSLRAFHNLCRHRGTQLLRAVGKKQKALTCPYHDWTYDLSGQLINVPEREKEFPDLDISNICLHKASVDIWRGMIWVHPSPDADPITTWFDGCWEYMGPHDPNRLIEYPDSRYEKVINANWKIIAENYIDVYHLSHLHSHTLQMYDHSSAKFGFVGDHYMFWEPLSSKYRNNLDKLIPYKRIKEMTDDYIGAYVPWLFPNLGLSETESSWSIFHCIPMAPDRTKVIVRSKLEPMSTWEYTKQSMKSYNSWHGIMGSETKYGGKPDEKSEDPMDWNDFMEEDVYVCEQLQKSLKNPLFKIQHTARYGEESVRTFQQIIGKWTSSQKSGSKEQIATKEDEEKENKNEIIAVDNAEVMVTLHDENHTIHVPKGKTILQTAKEANLKPPFSCEGGVCGTCKARLISGKAEMKHCMALDDKEIAEGWILTCQSLPTSSSLHIEYPTKK